MPEGAEQYKHRTKGDMRATVETAAISAGLAAIATIPNAGAGPMPEGAEQYMHRTKGDLRATVETAAICGGIAAIATIQNAVAAEEAERKRVAAEEAAERERIAAEDASTQAQLRQMQEEEATTPAAVCDVLVCDRQSQTSPADLLSGEDQMIFIQYATQLFPCLI